MAQLRYYWRPAGSQLARAERSSSVDTIEVAIINAVLFYGFEYLGNSDRLVTTPLTDRCYRTLMGAFHLSMAGGLRALRARARPRLPRTWRMLALDSAWHQRSIQSS